MPLNIPLFKEVSEVAGAPGHEDRVRAVVMREVKPLVDEVTVDNLGNLIAFRKGREGKRIMAAAHMDEISFIIKHIDDDGFLRFHTLGGFDPKTLTAQRVIVHGTEDVVGCMGSKPIHLMTQEERQKPLKIDDYFIDLGMPKADIEKIVTIGDVVTRERTLIEMGNCINGKSLDNRVAVFVLIEALRALKGVELPYDFHAVFTVQEEVGIRGAMVASHAIDPDFGLAIDVTIANDTPGAAPHERVTKLGEGVAIKIMDSSVICDPRMVKFMKAQADEQKIKYQLEVLTGGGTDTAYVQRMGKKGAIAGCVSVPTRNVHQVIEMAHKDDLQGAIDIMAACVKHMDKGQWTRES